MQPSIPITSLTAEKYLYTFLRIEFTQCQNINACCLFIRSIVMIKRTMTFVPFERKKNIHLSKALLFTGVFFFSFFFIVVLLFIVHIFTTGIPETSIHTLTTSYFHFSGRVLSKFSSCLSGGETFVTQSFI